MAALLVHGNRNISCTDAPCQWTHKTKSKDRQTVRVSQLYPTTTDYKALDRPVNSDDRQSLYSSLKRQGHQVGFLWALAPEPPMQELLIPTFDDIIISNEFVQEVNKVGYVLSKLESSKDNIKKIAEITKGQRDNPLWLIYRKGRITASNFGSVIAAIKRKRYPESLFKTLLGEYDLSSVRAIQWGIEHETCGVAEFDKQLNVATTDAGLWLHRTGILGASPDGLVGEDTVVEVKCLYKYRTASVSDAIEKEKDFIVQKDPSGSLTVNTSHKFYHQVQGQLYLTGRNTGQLVLWTPAETRVFEILKCPSWEANITAMIDFYVNTLLPRILQGKV